MGESVEDVYTCLETGINYTNMKIPLKSALTLTFPGSQEDGFKKFGMFINFDIHTLFSPQWDVWLGMQFRNVGNDVGTNVGIVPKMGVLFYPLAKTTEAGSGGNESQSNVSKTAYWNTGLAGGYTNNELYTSTAGNPNTKYEHQHGFEAAVPVRYQIRPWFAVQGELQYIQKNYTWRYKGLSDRVHSTITNSFIDLPLMAHFSVGNEKFRAFANLGAYGGMWIYSWRKGTSAEDIMDPVTPEIVLHDYNEKAEFNNQRDARFDGGLLAGLGVQSTFNPITVFLEGRYYYGLTDLQQNYSNNLVPRMNSTFNIRLGALFSLKRGDKP
jgi:hypothetical protein